MCIARLKHSLAKSLTRMCSGYAENYTTLGLRMSGHGAAEIFIDFSEELNHTETNPMCKFTKAVVRHADIRAKSIGWMTCPRYFHQRNPNAPKFEDQFQEETE